MGKCKYCKADCAFRGEDRETDCLGYIATTNADRIRAMSDEELAKWLMEDSWDCNDCPEHERLGGNPWLRDERCDEKCVEHCLDWLRQPVKDGEDE